MGARYSLGIALAVMIAACAPADPPAGTNARSPTAMMGDPAMPGGGAGVPSGGSGGTAGRPPPPPPAGASGTGGGGAGGSPAAGADAGPDAAPAVDAGPDPLPFCDDADAGSDEPQGSCVAIGDFRVQYKAGDTDPADNAIKPHFDLWNDGSEAVPLSELTVRYWYTREGSESQVFWCDYAQIDCANVRGAFMPAEGQGANFYMEVSFTSGTLAAGAHTGEVQTRFNKENWSVYAETDDHSYDPGHAGFADAPKVTLYRRGTLAWGAEPPL